MSQLQLAQKLIDAGHERNEKVGGVISGIERRQRRVTLDEVLLLCAVLDVPPPHLFFPKKARAKVELAPKLSPSSHALLQWIRGGALDDGATTYTEEIPEIDFPALDDLRARAVRVYVDEYLFYVDQYRKRRRQAWLVSAEVALEGLAREVMRQTDELALMKQAHGQRRR